MYGGNGGVCGGGGPGIHSSGHVHSAVETHGTPYCIGRHMAKNSDFLKQPSAGLSQHFTYKQFS